MTVPRRPELTAETLFEAQAMAGVTAWEWTPETREAFSRDFRAFLRTVLPEDRAALVRVVDGALHEGKDFDFVMRVKGEDGRPRTLHAVGTVRVDPATGRTIRILGATQDITDRARAEAALSDSERRFRAAFDDAAIGMALVAADGSFLRVNRAAEEILGRPADALLRLTFQDLTHPDDLATDEGHVAALLAGEADSYSMEKRYLRPGGEIVCARLSVSIVRDPQGSPEYFVSQIQDVSEERRLREHLHHLADHDGLTGLRNRRRFDEDLAVQASRCDRYGEQAAILLLDLNDFKSVNDTHGHHAGDEVLCRVAAVVSQRLRRSDSAARIGGDEFAALLLGAASGEAEAIAAQIAAEVGLTAGHGVTAAHGVARLGPGISPEAAMRTADRAMYRTKAAAHAGSVATTS